MLAYAFYVLFVGGFVAIAALGHLLLISALHPNLFGEPGASAAPGRTASPARTAPLRKFAA